MCATSKSVKTVSLNRSSAVIELGKRLASQLDADGDLLGAWMAHWIAELIANVETAQDKAAAQEVCAAAVLNLWAHRNSLPLTPLRELDPVLRAIASLDPEGPDFRYFGTALRAAAQSQDTGEAKNWLDLAFGLDYSAKVLIHFALKSAAQNAASGAAPWVKLAEEAGAEAGLEGPVIRFILESRDTSKNDDAIVEELSRRIARLEGFVQLAASMAEQLRQQLSELKN
jgi:hypothetical protein